MYKFTILDLIPYLIMVIVLITIMNSKGGNKQKAWACFILLFSFASIRYGIGDDYYRYKQTVLNGMDNSQFDRFEPLSRLLVVIAHYTHYQVFFIMSSFLILYPLYKVCLKLSINPACSLVFYFLFPYFFLDSLSIVRNHIAYVFVLLAYVSLRQKMQLRSLLMILIAFMFHRSALIGLMIYPFYYIKLSPKIHFILYILSFALSAIVMLVISAYSEMIPLLANVDRYIMIGKEGGRSMIVVINGLCLFHFLIWRKLTRISDFNRDYLVYFNFGVCLWNTFIFADVNVALRLSSFFLLYILFLAPQYKYCVKVALRPIVGMCTYAFFLSLFVMLFYLSVSGYKKDPSKMNSIPYQTFFYKKDYINYTE